ncbi:MAG TPA: cupin domain-containing protein [Thermoplasmata archaeon]|nr:MAG TPA: cupin domain-containing protein [Thermoplasmata archaeon]
MRSIFPEQISTLPQVCIPVKGATGYLLQGDHEQVVCMEFEQTVKVPEHSHDSQWEIVLEGEVHLTMDGATQVYRKGDRFFIPKGKKHGATVHAGYSCIMFFNQKDRYAKKE